MKQESLEAIEPEAAEIDQIANHIYSGIEE